MHSSVMAEYHLRLPVSKELQNPGRPSHAFVRLSTGCVDIAKRAEPVSRLVISLWCAHGRVNGLGGETALWGEKKHPARAATVLSVGDSDIFRAWLGS